ncbi:transcriptional regulator [bacterium]|nr:transcriptional regulator [bacterium]
MRRAKQTSPSPVEPAEIDPVIHQPARLLIVANLYVVEETDFVFLKRTTQLTDGNLSTHLMKLEEAGYIDVVKEFVDRRPRTSLRLTARGREAFETYRASLTSLLSAVK